MIDRLSTEIHEVSEETSQTTTNRGPPLKTAPFCFMPKTAKEEVRLSLKLDYPKIIKIPMTNKVNDKPEISPKTNFIPFFSANAWWIFFKKVNDP
jgi:hypothetical protein